MKQNLNSRFNIKFNKFKFSNSSVKGSQIGLLLIQIESPCTYEPVTERSAYEDIFIS